MNLPVAASEADQRRPLAAQSMLGSYHELAEALLGKVSGTALLDQDLAVQGEIGALQGSALAGRLQDLGWLGQVPRSPQATQRRDGQWLVAVALESSDGRLLGVFCAQFTDANRSSGSAKVAAATAAKLKPLLGSLQRELAASCSRRSKEQTLAERTQELEWLFKVTQELNDSSDDRQVLGALLEAATARLSSSLGAIFIPDRRLEIAHAAEAAAGATLRAALAQARQHLLTWVQRRNRPLVVNQAGRSAGAFPPCKILCVPIVLSSGRVIGALVFINPTTAPDFSARQVYLARHLGRQSANLVEAQFDLMTGLYTRSGLEQVYARVIEQTPDSSRSVIYIDVDRMHLVNELHGFELGNELIVRVADLLGSSLLGAEAVAARLSGDRFAVLLPAADPREAVELAGRIREAAARIAIGPADGRIDVSISCGVSALVDMPQGLPRALAAAEIACKLAKDRGRNRVELYACEDSSMMRRRDDMAAVGQLREALKAERIVLYAQRIAPLQNPALPGGYEILMRLRNTDGTLLAPGPVIAAAQRYQLLPSVDRWVTQRALQQLAPYRSMLQTRGIYMSINVSGQSLCDETLIQHLVAQMREARLPRGSITIEITEQAAVTNFARASSLLAELRGAGCRLALDDFGTGANTLTSLKNLEIGYLKIDGSFVKDILTSRSSRATVHGVVELAKGLEMTTIAEYVESRPIAECLREMGVDFAQGYAFGQPEPLEKVLEELSHDESARLHRAFLEM